MTIRITVESVSTPKSSAIDEAESVEPCSPKTSPGWTSNVSESTAVTVSNGRSASPIPGCRRGWRRRQPVDSDLAG